MTRHRTLAIVLFTLPALTLYTLFVLLPAVDALRVSFYRWHAVSPDRYFIGLSNFSSLVHDPIYWKALRNNLAIVGMTVGFCLPVALFLASVVAITRIGAGFFKAVAAFPFALGDVAIAILWIFIYYPTFGLLNSLLRQVGLDNWARPWLGSPSTALVAVTVPLIWKWLGFYTLLLLGGIYNIDPAINEAATIDGVTEWKRFWYITLPLIRRNVIVALVFMFIASFNAVLAFTQLMTRGGPARATETVPSYLVEQAFQYSNFGYGSAMGVSMLVITAIVAFCAIRSLLTEEKG